MESKHSNAITATDVRRTLALDVPAKSRWWRVARLALIVVALASVVAAVTRRRPPDANTRYVTADIGKGDLEVSITATGTVETLHTVEVGSEVTGRVLRVLVEPNERVKKGQVLAVIDPEPLKATMEQGQAQVAAQEASLRQARATLEESRADADRQRQLAAQNLISKKDLQSATATEARSEAAVQTAAANVGSARALLQQARSKLDRATVVSPVNGVVLTRLVEVGQTVTAGFTTPVLFKIAEDLTQMRLEVDIDEADVGRAKEGQRASFTVEAYPSRSFPSVLTSLRYNPTTSSNVVTYKGILSVDNRDMSLRPGMTATATIVTETKRNVVLVPNAALRFTPPKRNGPGAPAETAKAAPAKGERSVYVLDGERGLKRIGVKVGATDGTHSELLGDALPVGSKVVVDLQGGETP
jgi:HlyD family secretion protein